MRKHYAHFITCTKLSVDNDAEFPCAASIFPTSAVITDAIVFPVPPNMKPAIEHNTLTMVYDT